MKLEIKLKRKGINLTKNFELEEDFQFFSKTLDSKILRGGSYQTPPDNLSNSKILREGSY